jgi:hypothetical protein
MSYPISSYAKECLSNYNWLYFEYMTQEKTKEIIASELGVGIGTIDKYMKLHNIKCRPGKGLKRSDATRKHISEAALKRAPLSPEAIAYRNSQIRKSWEEHPERREEFSKRSSGENNGNYGRKHTPEERAVMSAAQANRVVTPEQRRQMSIRNRGSGNPNYGNHLSDAAKASISAANTGRTYSPETIELMKHVGPENGMYGKHHTPETLEKISLANTGRFPSKETLKKISEKLSGPGNPSWIDGRSYEPYCADFSNSFKELIRDKFERTCFICENQKKKMEVN